MCKQLYNKPFLSSTEHVALLKNRGLIIDNNDKVIKYLRTIGYFRLSAYFYPLLRDPKREHQFKPNSTFESALEMYRFDRKLRILLFNEIEKIEVGFRSIIVNTCSMEFNDINWISNALYFKNSCKFDRTIKQIDFDIPKSKEDFIIHFERTYSDKYPPSWMLAETITLGSLYYIYKNLKSSKVKKMIALEFKIYPEVLESWMDVIVDIRNICCHHSRVWNREFAKRPSKPIKPFDYWIKNEYQEKKLYIRICIIAYLLNQVSPNNKLKDKLLNLFSTYPTIDIKALGFPENWVNEPLWENKYI